MDFGRPPRGNVAGGKGYAAKGNRRKRQRYGIAGPYPEKLACDEACDAERDGQANRDPEHGKHQGFTKNQREDLALARVPDPQGLGAASPSLSAEPPIAPPSAEEPAERSLMRA